MKKEFAYGVIPFRKRNGIFEFLLVQHKGGAKHWSFPKGRVEEGEEGKETAMRELEEETGLKAELLEEPTFSHTYEKTWEGEVYDKKAIYFIGAVSIEKEPTIQEDELVDADWFSYEEAHKKITFGDTKEILERAHEYLATQ